MYQCYQGHYDSCAFGTFRPPSFSGDVLGYWERSFFQRMRSLYKFSGLPEAGRGQVGWDYDALLYQLLRMGYAVVFNTKTYGLVVQQGAPGVGIHPGKVCERGALPADLEQGADVAGLHAVGRDPPAEGLDAGPELAAGVRVAEAVLHPVTLRVDHGCRVRCMPDRRALRGVDVCRAVAARDRVAARAGPRAAARGAATCAACRPRGAGPGDRPAVPAGCAAPGCPAVGCAVAGSCD